jgi:alkaline phosphatase
MPRLRLLVNAAWLGILGLVMLRPAGLAQAQRTEAPARRVLLFIGDGMGDSEITAARNYAVGAAGHLAMDTLPSTGAYTTYSVQEIHPHLPDYVPDSAATATAWATGTKTSNGRIATAPGTGQDLRTIMEIAHDRGLLTGDVTTAEITDATPAALAAHVPSRTCQGPSDMMLCPAQRKSAGGAGSIAEQEIDHKVDVLLGGGRARFEQTTDAGHTVLQTAVTAGYEMVTTKPGLDEVRPGRRVLGLFTPGNMTTEWDGQEALPYPSNVTSPQRCEEHHRPAVEPSLADMTTNALRLLDRLSNTRGFFLQVEGASIDKQDHLANPCGQIGETVAFDRAITVGLDYVRLHPETLMIVTADHAQASQIVPIPTDTDHPAGLVSVLMTFDKAPMAIAYSTNTFHRSQEHTGTQVRIAAIGPHAVAVGGVTDQTDLFRLMQKTIEGR